MVAARPLTRGDAMFSALGRSVVRRPLVPIVAWVVLLAVALPFLSHLNGVTTNSTESLPSNAPSALAEERLAQLFPNATTGTSTILLFSGPDLTGPAGQGLILNVSAALLADRSLVDVASVSSVYSLYTAYLAGQAQLAAAVVDQGVHATPNVSVAVNGTAELLWTPPALFLHTWEGWVANSSEPPNASNAPAYRASYAALANSTESQEVLTAFYAGTNGSATGFNGSEAACASDYGHAAALTACADASARANVAPILSRLAGTNQTVVDPAVLTGLGVENFTSAAAQRGVAATVLAVTSGLPAGWLDQVWSAFDASAVSAAQAGRFASALVNASTLASEPLPVPPSILSEYVNPARTASLITVDFSVAEGATNSSGRSPVGHDLSEIDSDVQRLLSVDDPTGTIAYYQTGPAPLNELSTDAVNASLVLVLPLTVGLLLGIAMLYFRSPVAPLVAFGALGIALVLGLGGTVLLGTLVTHVDSTALVLEEVFVLGVGTDYSVFLLARYREELVRGRSSEEAIETAVSWAGQSIATSGSTAIIVTIALTFSGVALLAQWGMVLSLAILITMLVALTLLPALLRLVGPRLFWPISGERFRRSAALNNARAASGATYFYRAARFSKRRAGPVVLAILLVSVPLVAVALQVPLSYDFYDQLPGGHEATEGLSALGNAFGPGYAVPSFALVTFADPLVRDNVSNATEFTDLAELGVLATSTSGIAAVRSPVGPDGANLSLWLGLASEPSAERTNLLALLAPFVGSDGRTVLMQIQPTEAGLSYGAVAAMNRVESAFRSFADDSPAITALAFGGGAPTIGDIASETAVATEVMLVAVTIGLILVLLVVLRSWIIALMAVATIGLSISWAWALTDLVLQDLFGVPVFFYVRTILIMLVLGLGIDYNIFLLTRVREERVRGRSAEAAVVEAVGRTGGIITAAAVILACAFAALLAGEFTLIRAIGFSVAIAVVMDAMIVRTYLVPASLQLLGERVWNHGRRGPPAARTPAGNGSSEGPGSPT